MDNQSFNYEEVFRNLVSIAKPIIEEFNKTSELKVKLNIAPPENPKESYFFDIIKKRPWYKITEKVLASAILVNELEKKINENFSLGDLDFRIFNEKLEESVKKICFEYEQKTGYNFLVSYWN